MATSSLKASVIIPSKNGGPLLLRVVEAVVTQNTDWPFEVIVIDSGSTDGTRESLQQMDGVKLLDISPSDFGHGRTRNQAIECARGEFIAMLTHDALPASSYWLAELVSCIEKEDDIAGVFGRHIAYPQASPFTRQELEMHFSGFDAQPIVRLEDAERYRVDIGYRQFLHFFSDNNALLRRSVWETIPYPDVDFAEDQAWAQLIIEAGYAKSYAANAVVYHSHDYSLIERFQRSFDESLAFNRLFSYCLCPSLRHLFLSWMALGYRDWRYACTTRLWRSNIGQLCKMPFDHLARLLGHYVGSFGTQIPTAIASRLSRDKRLFSGLTKV